MGPVQVQVKVKAVAPNLVPPRRGALAHLRHPFCFILRTHHIHTKWCRVHVEVPTCLPSARRTHAGVPSCQPQCRSGGAALHGIHVIPASQAGQAWPNAVKAPLRAHIKTSQSGVALSLIQGLNFQYSTAHAPPMSMWNAYMLALDLADTSTFSMRRLPMLNQPTDVTNLKTQAGSTQNELLNWAGLAPVGSSWQLSSLL